MLKRLEIVLRALSRRAVARLAVFSALSLVCTVPILKNAGAFNAFRDAQVLTAYETVAEKSVLAFGELPLWNPYYCGGMYALGTPQSRFASPTFLISLLFGSVNGQALIAFLMFIAGMEGFYRYAKERTASGLGPLLFAPVFAFNGFMAHAFFRGWLSFFGFLLFPWVLHGIDRAARGRIQGVFLAAAGFAFMVGFGGTYAGPIAALFAIIQVIRIAIERGRAIQARAAAFYLGLTAMTALFFSAFRLYPVFETLYSAPRIMAGAPGHTLESLAAMVFETAKPRLGAAGSLGYMYLGVPPALIALFGIHRRKGAVIAGAALLSIWAATGYAYGVSPFALLRELPLFSMLRYPERFLFVAGLFTAELAAFGVDRLIRLERRRPKLRLLLPLVLVLALLSVAMQIGNADAVFDAMWLSEPPAELDRPFHQARGNRWALGYFAPMARGSLSCFEAYPVNMSPLLRGDLDDEAYLRDPAKGRVSTTRWSPNRIVLSASLSQPARVLVNQNWHQGWRASVGEVVRHEGLLAVDLPSGAHRVTLRFCPRSALVGATVSLLALLGMLWVLLTARGRTAQRWLQAAVVLAPPTVIGAVLLFAVREPAPREAVVRNANGEVAFIDALPEGAKRIDADFAVPVTLLGATLPKGVDALGIADFELYFQVHGAVPRSAGVFVHVVGPNGFNTQENHDVLAASLFFDDVPPGQVVRDAFSLVLPKGRRGSYAVYAGLRHASGNRARIDAFDAAGAPIEGDRVYLGTFQVP